MGIFSKKPKSNAVIMQPAVSEVDKALNTIQKINGMYNASMGIGDYNSDPIESMTVVETPVFGTQARLLYRNLDLMQRIIDSPVNDSLKNGYEITTNLDAELGINDMISERLEELHFDDAMRQFAIHSRLYSKGGLIYPVVREFEESRPDQPLNFYNLERIDALNVVYEEHITYFTQIINPLTKDYGNIKQLYLLGNAIHPSRYFLHVLSFDPFLYRGISILDRVKRAVYGINIANWTVTELLRRYRVLLVEFDPKNLALMTGEQKTDAKTVLELITRRATSKSTVPIPAGAKFEYLQSQLTDIDKAIGTLYDFLGAVTEIPQRKIRGSAGGELAAADTDERQYHEMLESKMHKMTFDPMMRFVIDMVVNERKGKIFKTLFDNDVFPEQLEIDIKFNPIASVNPETEARIEVYRAQADATDIQSGVISPDIARKLRPRYESFQDEIIPEPDFDQTGDGQENNTIPENTEIQNIMSSLGLN